MSVNGVKFNDIHSYYDLNLILSQCSISPAKAKEKYLEIPGADGDLDLTESLGEVKYHSRTGSLIFTVRPSDDFEEKKSEISNLLNGRYFEKITLDKDPDFYYQGRCFVNDWKCDKTIGRITVDLKLKPWKLKQKITEVVIDGLNSFVAQPFVLINNRMPAVVTATINGNVTITFNDIEAQYGTATDVVLSYIRLTEGENTLLVKGGTYTVLTLKYQEGSL